MKLVCRLALVLHAIAFGTIVHAGTIKGNGDMGNEEREVNDFSTLEVSGSISVSYSPSKESKCEIKADSNLMDIIKTEVDGKKLRVYTSKNYSTNNDIFVMCESKAITTIVLNGSGSIEASKIQSQDLNISVKGSGNIILSDSSSSVLNANTNGSGDIIVSGSTNTLSARVNGSGDVMASDLSAKNSNLVIMGSGNIYSSTSDESLVSIMGSGDIVFSDSPKTVSKNILGSGAIKVN